MEAFVTGLHVILCLFLILVVLLQPGKGADFGAMMGGSTAQTGSAAQGATLIGKLTAVVATLFMVTSMSLAWFSNQGQSSVMTDEALQQELEEQEREKAGDPALETPDEGSEAPDDEGNQAPAGGGGEAPEGDGGGGEAPEGDGGDQPSGDEAPDGDGAPSGDGEQPANDDPAPDGE
jgi:preprotein translocase subunit SecG